MFKNSKNRLDAISDGIFAVVLTIMVLNIKVPESVSATSIHQLIKEIIIYLISVAVVSQYWFFHQDWLNNNLFSRITVITFALILTSANFFQYLLFRLILIDSTQINKHDLEEKRSALIMLISSFGYLLIGGIFPPILLILVILSLFIRSTVAFILRKI